MGILSKAFELRASLKNIGHPRDPVIKEWLGGGINTAAGIAVTPETAMQEATVYACINVLAESIAQLDLHLYKKRKSGGKDRATDHPLYEILHEQPNARHTSFDFFDMIVPFVALRGNSVSKIISAGGRGVKELLPLEPDRVEIFLTGNGKRAFRYYHENGGVETLLQDEVFHVAYRSLDGIAGLSPINYHRETVGAALAVKEFGSRFFQNGTHLGTLFEHPEALSEEAYNRLKDSLENKWSGVVNAGKTMIVEEGMKVAKLGMSAGDAQYLESRKFSRSEIAGVFRVPSHMINDLEKATFSNVEHLDLAFVKHTLGPWLKRIEKSVSRDLISPQDRARGYIAKFNVNELMKGDVKARGEYYKARFHTGSITPNQIKALEDENPEEGGDTCFVPLNMVPIDQAGQVVEGKKEDEEENEGS